MSISELANSLANGANISLSSPFILKKVTINAHPSSEAKNEKSPGIITKDDLNLKPNVYQKINIQPKSIALYENLELPDSAEIASFSQSEMGSSSYIEKCINNGYTPEEAVAMMQAKQSYGINESFYRSGVYALSTTCVEG